MKQKFRKKTFIILLILLIILFCVPSVVYARAGGGGGGGSSGGSGGGSRSHSSGRRGTNNPIGVFIHGTIFALFSSGGAMVFVYRSRKAKRKSIELMKSYEKLGINWDYHEIQEYVENAYFIIQESWRRYDPFYASAYLSEELAGKWKTQLEWMKIRSEEIVQKNVKLFSAIPVGVHDEAGEEKDQIWYLIHGKMIGYYRDFDTKRIIRGNPRAEDFYEYWLFIRRDGKWVLHEIRQKNEIDIQEFING